MSVDAAVGATAPANDAALSDLTADTGAAPATQAADAGSPDAAAGNIDNELRAIWDKHNPPRGESGRFTSHTPEGDAAAAPVAADDPALAAETDPAAQAAENSADNPEDAKPEPAKPAIEAPHSWSAEEKARWASVPPETQAYIARRETEAHQAITRAGEQVKTLEQQVKAYEPIDQLITANKDDFARRGVTPAQSFSVLLEAQRSLDANPAAGLVQIGLSYGIDLRPVFAGQQQHATDNGVAARLQSRIDHLEKQLSATSSKVTEREQSEQQARATALADERTKLTRVVEDFSKDKPYWQDLESDVFDMVKVLRDRDSSRSAADLLQDAYERATWANPTIRARIQQDQQRTAEEKRQADAKAKAGDARKAASVNVRSAPSAPNPKTTDDMLREIAAKHYGRAS